jgi:anti-anti-sigma factor
MARIRSGGRSASQESGVGSYYYDALSDAWEWSDGIYAIHGFTRGEVVPTTALLLAHAHSGDRRNAERLIQGCLDQGRLFSFLYRIIDAGGKPRWVLMVAEGAHDAAGAVAGLRGYLIDLTGPQARARSKALGTAMRKAVASRAAIEQAKGALMLVYGLDAEAAFALLSWQSQHTNIKLRDLAERLVAAVADAHATTGLRQRLDEVVYSLPETATAAASDDGYADLLTAALETRHGAVVLRLGGEVDMATGPSLDKYLGDASAVARPPAPIVVDLSDVRHLGLVGVALLTAYHGRCQAAGIPLRVVTGDGPAARVLSVVSTGLSVYPGVPDALAADEERPGRDPAGVRRHSGQGAGFMSPWSQGPQDPP